MLLARRTLLRQTVAFGDVLTLIASFAAAYVCVGFLLHRNFKSFANYAWLIALIVPVWLVCLCEFGLYTSAVYTRSRVLIERVLRTQSVAGLTLFAAMYLTRSESVSRLLLQSFLGISLVMLTAQKFVLRSYLLYSRRRSPGRRRRVLLVASSAAAIEHYMKFVSERASMLADVIGVLTPVALKSHFASAAVLPILGTAEDFPSVLQTRVVDEVVVASAITATTLERLSRSCAIRGILICVLVEVPRSVLGVWNADYMGDGAFMLSLSRVPQNAHHLALKRVADVLGAAIGLCACGIAFLCYGRRLRRETGDSVLFRQERVGWNGRRFTLYKFRTMRAGAEEIKATLYKQNTMNGPIFKLKDDPRVTPTGHKLRRRHLDELPQFWNVMKGEMSLVGTRPPTCDETAIYSEHHQRRLSIKPGLTGLWQLHGNDAVNDFEDVVKLDCEYIDNWSLWLDAKIVAKTVTKVMRGDAW
jgi:exopolysaccharide biosynthesis polyprenyl glycosylphosphotransferase